MSNEKKMNYSIALLLVINLILFPLTAKSEDVVIIISGVASLVILLFAGYFALKAAEDARS